MAPTQAKRSIFVDSDSYEPVHSGGKPGWVYPAYYTICGYYILSGLVGILAIVLNKKSDLTDPFSILFIAVGALSVLIGIGLLAKVEIIRGIVNFFSFVKILGALRGILGSFGMILLSTGLGIAYLIFNVIDLAAAVMMIYLIGETD